MKLDSAIKIQQQRQQRNQRVPKGKPEKQVEAKPPVEPTPERAAMGLAEKAFIHNHEEGTKKEIWRIQSWHTMMHNRGKLNDDQARVLSKYVAQWDIANRSPLKSNLDKTPRDGHGPSFSYLQAQKNLRHWDARIGRQSAKELSLVVCQSLGYEGAARALFGATAKRSDANRIKSRLVEDTIPKLDEYMK